MPVHSISRRKLRFWIISTAVLFTVLIVAGGAYFVYRYPQTTYEGTSLKMAIPRGWKKLDLEQAMKLFTLGDIPSQGEAPQEDTLVLVHPSGLSVTVMVYPAAKMHKDNRDTRNPRWLAPRIADLYRAECIIWQFPPTDYLYETSYDKFWVLSGVIGNCDVLILAQASRPVRVAPGMVRRLLRDVICSLQVKGSTLNCKQLSQERVAILPAHAQEWHALGVTIILPSDWIPADLLLPGSYLDINEHIVQLPLVQRSHPQRRLTVWFSLPTSETRQEYMRYRAGISRRLSAREASALRYAYRAGKHRIVRITTRRERNLAVEWYCFAEGSVCFAKSTVSRQNELPELDALVATIVNQLDRHTTRD